MSDIPADDRGRLDLSELVSRIERQQEETRKFVAEQHKLSAEEQKLRSETSDFVSRIERQQEETRKFVAEQHKLLAEARKLDRDRSLAPWQATAITIASIGALVASVVSLAKSMGWL